MTDDMAEYLQTFLDETEEQLDDLVETLLALERDSNNKDDLNEAFRLIHSIKGSAGMMGFDSITVLAHQLENRFELFRSGSKRLDEPTMNLVLRCIDFLRQCKNRLRDSEQLGSSAKLLEELKQLEEQEDGLATDQPEQTADEAEVPSESTDSLSSPDEHGVSDTLTRMIVRFRSGLQLADLKAQLIVARLSGLGELHSTLPDEQQLASVHQLEEFEIRIETHESYDRLRVAADVDGVEAIDFPGALIDRAAEDIVESAAEPEQAAIESHDSEASSPSQSETESPPVEPEPTSRDAPADVPAEPVALQQQSTTPEPLGKDKPVSKVAETMRVDIDRLDNLMNLAGELVVNRARFVQISGQISPQLRKATMLNRIRDFSDGLRRTIESLEDSTEDEFDRSSQIQQLRSGLDLMEEQSTIWENGRHNLTQISEAIDQLSRVSHSLQRGVLDTRMAPVGPLFHRFKRVVRDLSKERGKRVNLEIRGEKTELDKRMIDELGDPLVHLVRNSIDHGLESPEVRAGCGKPEVGTIYLEASHSGNNVYIHVRDDGGGIDVEKIKTKLIDNRILTKSAVEQLSNERVLDYIWHPGFSTANEVTDVSGRGVGMDVVKTRINKLNGTIEVDTTLQQETTFMLRLPLTLAIIDCLLVRLRNVIFSMPVDDVREIVSVDERDVITVQGRQTFDLRDEYIPLVNIDDVFHWHSFNDFCSPSDQTDQADSSSGMVEAVILHHGDRTMGLRVDELLGSQDIVIKSLSDNFTDVPGLSGASILGDGSVCLMLDVGIVIDTATKPSRTPKIEDKST